MCVNLSSSVHRGFPSIGVKQIACRHINFVLLHFTTLCYFTPHSAVPHSGRRHICHTTNSHALCYAIRRDKMAQRLKVDLCTSLKRMYVCMYVLYPSCNWHCRYVHICIYLYCIIRLYIQSSTRFEVKVKHLIVSESEFTVSK